MPTVRGTHVRPVGLARRDPSSYAADVLLFQRGNDERDGGYVVTRDLDWIYVRADHLDRWRDENTHQLKVQRRLGPLGTVPAAQVTETPMGNGENPTSIGTVRARRAVGCEEVVPGWYQDPQPGHARRTVPS